MRQKIFNLGLSRTGTMWLNTVFTQSGLRSAHFLGVDTNTALARVENLDCAGDTPIPSMARQLKSHYPEAKFVLTTRPKDKWLSSMEWMLKHGAVLWSYGKSVDAYHRNFYGTAKFDRRILGEFYSRYHAETIELFRDEPHRLLLIDIEKKDLKAIAAFCDLEVENFAKEQNPINARRNASFKARVKWNLKKALGRIP